MPEAVDTDRTPADRLARIGPFRDLPAAALADEVAAIDGRRGGAVLRAGTAVRLADVPRASFRALLGRHPAVAVHLLRDMIATVRGPNASLATLEGAHAEVERVPGGCSASRPEHRRHGAVTLPRHAARSRHQDDRTG